MVGCFCYFCWVSGGSESILQTLAHETLSAHHAGVGSRALNGVLFGFPLFQFSKLGGLLVRTLGLKMTQNLKI